MYHAINAFVPVALLDRKRQVLCVEVGCRSLESCCYRNVLYLILHKIANLVVHVFVFFKLVDMVHAFSKCSSLFIVYLKWKCVML